MEQKGRRFSDEHEVIEFPSSEIDKKEQKRIKREQKLKEKNSKKLEKLLKKQSKGKRVRSERLSDPVIEEDTSPNIAEDESPEPGRASSQRSSSGGSSGKGRFKKLTKKQIIAACVIVILLFGIVFFAANPERFSFKAISDFVNYSILNHDSDQSFPLDIQGENISAGNFIRKGQDICFSSDTRTVLLNSYGRTVFDIPHAYINPILRSSPKKSLVYNLGSTGYQVIYDNKVEYTSDAADNILVGDIIDNGTYAIVTQSSGYLSKLYVYDSENEQIFAYSFADYYVTSVSLNPSGNRAVVSGLSALDGVNVSSLYLLDFTKDTPVYLSEIENNIIYDVRYLNDKNVCAVGGYACYSFNTSNGEVEEYSYDGKALTAYDINTDTDTYSVSLSNSGDGRNCEIVSFNSAGKADKSFEVEEKIINISSYKGRIALLTNNEVMLYSKDGKAYNKKELRSDPHSVAMYTGSKVYVLCTGYIDTISL